MYIEDDQHIAEGPRPECARESESYLFLASVTGERTFCFERFCNFSHSSLEVIGVLQQSSAELLLVLLQHVVAIHQAALECRPQMGEVHIAVLDLQVNTKPS